MLSQDDLWFSEWRARELTRIARAGVTYVDYTGAALYPESLVRGDAERLAGTLLANPHSQSTASLAATRDVDAARTALLDFLNADPGEYAVVLTPNASGACLLQRVEPILVEIDFRAKEGLEVLSKLHRRTSRASKN